MSAKVINLTYDEAGKLAIYIGSRIEDFRLWFAEDDKINEDGGSGYMLDPGDPAERATHLLRKICRAADFAWPEDLELDLRRRPKP